MNTWFWPSMVKNSRVEFDKFWQTCWIASNTCHIKIVGSSLFKTGEFVMFQIWWNSKISDGFVRLSGYQTDSITDYSVNHFRLFPTNRSSIAFNRENFDVSWCVDARLEYQMCRIRLQIFANDCSSDFVFLLEFILESKYLEMKNLWTHTGAKLWNVDFCSWSRNLQSEMIFPRITWAEVEFFDL